MTRVCILIGGIFSGAEGRLSGFRRFLRFGRFALSLPFKKQRIGSLMAIYRIH